jgi:hypothetical protein
MANNDVPDGSGWVPQTEWERRKQSRRTADDQRPHA